MCLGNGGAGPGTAQLGGRLSSSSLVSPLLIAFSAELTVEAWKGGANDNGYCTMLIGSMHLPDID